ncbi:CYIR protein [Plasmodium cynomolgi strain B]|uniref:CYIR protein n=1 Tax=Plasmodium cynomolgi (strain B) TaxID=1120755 RepID=K6V2X6_PLACD|nr:CYIR protein [Plasmodium cynomolgi strain B]GAB69665.1 CYIR protein [Plasmodium cynomolgi strain B]
MLWIFDEISKFFRSNSYYINHLYVLKKFHDVEELIIEDINRKNDRTKYLCRSYFTYHDLQERKNVKYLHDYIKNYNKIKQYVISDKTDCEKYRKYFEFIKTLYEKHKEECCKYWNTECHKYFSCDPFYDPNNILSVLESCENGKFNGMLSAKVKSVSKDSEKEFNMKIKNVRCVAYKYEDYGFLSCFDSPLTHNVTIKGNEKVTWNTESGKYIPSRSRGLEFFTRSTIGIPKKLYPIKKDKGKKNNQMKTTDVILGMKNSKCKITRENKAKGIVELSCNETSSTKSANIVDGQEVSGKEVLNVVPTKGKINKPDERLVWKRLKHSKEEACSTDLLGFCVDPQNTYKNKAREEKIEYKSSYTENEIPNDSNTIYFDNSEKENSILNSLYTKIGLVSALVLGSFLVNKKHI